MMVANVVGILMMQMVAMTTGLYQTPVEMRVTIKACFPELSEERQERARASFVVQ